MLMNAMDILNNKYKKIFTDIDGIQESRHLHDWLLHKD